MPHRAATTGAQRPAGTVPALLSQLAMKLLAKTAEERYQTATGLERDLQLSLADWERQRRIDDFPLGQYDTPDRLSIPEKLYGRGARSTPCSPPSTALSRAARRSWCSSPAIPASASPPSTMSCTRRSCRRGGCSRPASSTSTSATSPIRPWCRLSKPRAASSRQERR